MEKYRLKIQIAFAALLNIGVFQWHFVCFPVLNCHSCPISVFSCPMGIIGQFAGIGLFPLFTVGILALSGVLVGRLLCGWACPFGLIQDLLHKIPYVRFRVPEWTRYVKYAVLLITVIAVPVFLSPAFALYFCRLCPVGTIESSIPWAIINGTADLSSLAIRLGILAVLIVLMMGHHRFFCKVICPVGASLSFFNRFAVLFPSRNTECIDCSACSRSCPMSIGKDKQDFGAFESRAEECISCLECKKKCPTAAINIWG